jgi:hypothetical protein
MSEQHEGRLLLALEAFNAGHFQSHRAAATAFGVQQRALSRRAGGMTSRANSTPNSLKLTRTEEQTIIQYILDLDSRGFAPRLCKVKDMANKLLGVCNGEPVGKHWATRFVARQNVLKMAFNRPKDKQRRLQADSAVVGPWFTLVARYGVRPENTHNSDETGFQMGVIGFMKVLTGSERRGRPHLVQPGDREWVTVIQCI